MQVSASGMFSLEVQDTGIETSSAGCLPSLSALLFAPFSSISSLVRKHMGMLYGWMNDGCK